MFERPYYFDLAIILDDAFHKINISTSPRIVQSGAIVRESGIISRNCGGNAQYTVEGDDATGDFSGNFSFNNYCSQGVTLNGTANFSGKYDVQNDRFININLLSERISIIFGSDSISAKITISFSYQASPATATMSIFFKNNKDGKVYWVDYSMIFWPGFNFVEFKVSGKYYHPDYGYVVVSTPTNFRVYFSHYWPSQGVLVLDGKTGIAGGCTKAKLTVISSSYYRVEADTNGDGAYDWNSGILSWN